MEHEKEIIKAETRCIVDKCIALGHGDIILGAIAGINAGVIDIPFGPAKCNAGIMLPARDNTGAVRILEVGNLPFTDDLKKFHKEKLAERGKAEKPRGFLPDGYRRRICNQQGSFGRQTKILIFNFTAS